MSFSWSTIDPGFVGRIVCRTYGRDRYRLLEYINLASRGHTRPAGDWTSPRKWSRAEPQLPSCESWPSPWLGEVGTWRLGNTSTPAMCSGVQPLQGNIITNESRSSWTISSIDSHMSILLALFYWRIPRHDLIWMWFISILCFWIFWFIQSQMSSSH